jgi:hypothetical protein
MEGTIFILFAAATYFAGCGATAALPRSDNCSLRFKLERMRYAEKP